MSKVITDKAKIEEALSRGVEEVIEKEHLEKRLLSGERLKIKFGIDPTGSTLHLGHALPLRKLQQFLDLGHKVILLIGDFTATIGDPSGRLKERPPLSREEVKKNMKEYLKQASKVLDIIVSGLTKKMPNSLWSWLPDLLMLALWTVLNLKRELKAEEMLRY